MTNTRVATLPFEISVFKNSLYRRTVGTIIVLELQDSSIHQPSGGPSLRHNTAGCEHVTISGSV